MKWTKPCLDGRFWIQQSTDGQEILKISYVETYYNEE